MQYQFPVIKNISDILPAIEGCPEFVVAERGDYTIINYNVVMEDTFPSILVAGGSSKMREERMILAALRRECRGITFCTRTGNIIRRPLHKFFNIGEGVETQLNRLDFSLGHSVYTKKDGSMISPIKRADDLIWGTKMFAPDFHYLVKEFINDASIDYEAFAHEIIDMGFTPIFEYMSKKKRIVVDYPEDQLVLLAVRDMITGRYVDFEEIKRHLEDFEIPVVEIHSSIDDPNQFIENVRQMEGIEGFVIAWESGYRVKVKTDEYVMIHRAKEAILQDRNIVDLIINLKIDDVISMLPEEEGKALAAFENDFNSRLLTKVAEIDASLQDINHRKIDRKNFAINEASKFDGFTKAVIFRHFDDVSGLYDTVLKTIQTNLTKNIRWDELRNIWFPGLVYNTWEIRTCQLGCRKERYCGVKRDQ